ncbi:uncharacterized protein LOC117573680 [Drosophila albomicans]|uniref:Uncharacterized protein LOC117573680 n=1 Tax=Drosophila albomicans TaxID=7291 RepID=A0A6P8XNL9_DROAB|nr:uncharacterized protein LOC117573680 [Drosophila albomicans]
MKHARNCDLPATAIIGILLLSISTVGGTHAVSLTNAAAKEQELQLSLHRHLSFKSVQRMLRDENEPANYKSELRYYQKRETQTQHELHKREISVSTALLNLTAQGLTAYDSQKNYQGQFELVTHMDLSNNKLSSLKLDNFVQLKQLDVSNNSLTTLPAAGSMLVTLDLACNRLGQLSASYFAQRMPQLKHLNLAHNQLGNISRQAFYNLNSLETLLLSHNNITDIDYETFLALPNLQHLDLSHNQLSGSAIRALQGIPDLVSLSISHNPQVGTAMQEFVASWSLKELDASGTGLCQVPAALAQSVRTLKLSHNWLKAINCGDLDSYPLLQYLDLSYSQIAQVEDDALGRLELLEILFLDHNSLMRVPSTLPTSLEHLFMQHNHIMELQPQAFAALSNLKTLDLSGNRLLYLPALPLPKLLTLNLQSSGIESVSQSIVHTLPQLRDLLLEDNPIRCSDLLGIAEWASPCRSPDMGQSPGRIDLKSRFVQSQNFYEPFSSQCGREGTKDDAQQDEWTKSMPPTCGLSATAAATTTAPSTMLKVHKSKAAATATTTMATLTSAMQSSGNNIALVTAKTLGPVETTSLVKLQRQQMPGMPTATTTTTTATITTTALSQTATASGMPSLVAAAATLAANRTNILAAQPAAAVSSLPPASSRADVVNSTVATTTTPPKRLAMPTHISDVAEVATTATQGNVPQTISTLITAKEESQKLSNNTANSLLKLTTSTIETPSETSGQEVASSTSIPKAQSQPQLQHKHATLQLHIKNRHLIGTPLLMHKGDNLLVDAEQLLLPGTATVADAETLDASQQRQEATDKRQPDVIKGDTKATSLETTTEKTAASTAASTTTATTESVATATSTTAAKTHKKKNPSLSIKKMTYSTKHATTMKTTATATTTMREVTTTSSEHQQHQHSSVNTPNAVKQELSTFAQLKAFVDLKTEASKSAHLLDTRQETQQTLPGSHPGLMLLLACVLVIVLLAGLAHVYRCELPWQRSGRAGQTRPHHQRQFNENDDVHSFLHYQGSSNADPARLQAWHHSTRREAPYSSPLHNLQARELQREQQKLQFYSASLADSSIGSGSGSGSACSSGSSRSSLHSPSNEDSYYIEMAPSSPNAAANSLSSLPMELLSGSRSSGNVAATELGGGAATLTSATTLRSVSSKLMAPSSRRLGIW